MRREDPLPQNQKTPGTKGTKGLRRWLQLLDKVQLCFATLRSEEASPDRTHGRRRLSAGACDGVE